MKKVKSCHSCWGATEALAKNEALRLLKKQAKGWMLGKGARSIERSAVFKNFVQAVSAVNRIARAAERENHHPDIHLTSYRHLRVVLSTHSVKGLTKNDFALADKINDLFRDIRQRGFRKIF